MYILELDAFTSLRNPSLHIPHLWQGQSDEDEHSRKATGEAVFIPYPNILPVVQFDPEKADCTTTNDSQSDCSVGFWGGISGTLPACTLSQGQRRKDHQTMSTPTHKVSKFNDVIKRWRCKVRLI